MATVSKKKIKPLVSVLPIEPKDIERFWPLCEFMVAEALAFSGKYADPEFIFRELKKDVMQCWIMFGSDETEENKVFGVGVTKISQMPNYPQLEIIITTGKRRDLWEDQFDAEVVKFAKVNKCKRLNSWCRAGWERVSKKMGLEKNTRIITEGSIDEFYWKYIWWK